MSGRGSDSSSQWSQYSADRNYITFEKNIIKTLELDYVPNSSGLGVDLFMSMVLYKENLAQINAAMDTPNDTYDDLMKRCRRTAMEMIRRGVVPKDVITVCTYNHMNSCIPYLATLFVSSKISTIDPSISFEETKRLLSMIMPKMAFVIPECKNKYEKICKEIKLTCHIIIFDETSRTDSFTQFLVQKENEKDFRPTPVKDIQETALIFFSSGTSGLSKGICLSHYTMMCQGANYLACGYPNGVMLSFRSLYWLSSVTLLFHSIWSGTARLICKEFDPNVIWEHVENYRVTMMYLQPIQATSIIKSRKPNNVSISSLRYVGLIGGSLYLEYYKKLKTFIPNAAVCSVYGLIEIAGGATAFKMTIAEEMNLLVKRPSSCGRPIWGFWYKICHTETQKILGPNQLGELRLKTKYQLNGYYGMKTTEVWDSMGWLITGDVCYYDEDYCFYVVDRVKEVIKYQSRYISPTLLEAVLMEHPDVQEAVVIGLPHREDGERPMALVVLEPGAGLVTTQEIESFVKLKVGANQQLRAGVRIVESLPLNSSINVKRKVVKAAMLQELETKSSRKVKFI